MRCFVTFYPQFGRRKIVFICTPYMPMFTLLFQSAYKHRPALLWSPHLVQGTLVLIFDDTPRSFEEHVIELCRNALFHISNITCIRPGLSINSTKAFVHMLVTSHVDYCKALLSMAYLASLRCSRFLSFSKRSRTGGKLRKSGKISGRGRG